MSIRGGISLVDDVGERLERAQRLALKTLQAQLHLVYRDRQRKQHDDVPRMVDRQQRKRRAEPRLADARHEPGIEGLPCSHDVDQQGPDGQEGERQGD